MFGLSLRAQMQKGLRVWVGKFYIGDHDLEVCLCYITNSGLTQTRLDLISTFASRKLEHQFEELQLEHQFEGPIGASVWRGCSSSISLNKGLSWRIS